jgi:hypothetical protein
MRILGFALVVASLVLSTGGVRADSKSPNAVATVQQSLPRDDVSVLPAKNLPDQCGTVTPGSRVTRQPKLYRDTAKKAALPKGAIPLNTRGYNYGAPELQELQPGAKPPAAPAKP